MSLAPSLYQRNQQATVYAGNLDQKVSQNILWQLFVQCGPVVNIHIPRDKISNEHQGYGFIEFKSQDDADYSIKIMHMIKLFGKPIKVNKASQDKRAQDVGANLFIGNLDPEVDEKMLYETFTNFGMIINTKITRDSQDGTSKGHGFVSFDNFASADLAVQQMNGQYFSGRQIRVEYAVKKESKGERHGDFAERLLAENKPSSMSKMPALVYNANNPQQQQQALLNQQQYQGQMPIVNKQAFQLQQQQFNSQPQKSPSQLPFAKGGIKPPQQLSQLPPPKPLSMKPAMPEIRLPPMPLPPQPPK